MESLHRDWAWAQMCVILEILPEETFARVTKKELAMEIYKRMRAGIDVYDAQVEAIHARMAELILECCGRLLRGRRPARAQFRFDH